MSTFTRIPINFQYSDGSETRWPQSRYSGSLQDNIVRQEYIRVERDSPRLQSWLKALGQALASEMDLATPYLNELPNGYALFRKITYYEDKDRKPRTRDYYLFGGPKIFRSANEFTSHAIWLYKGASGKCICDQCYGRRPSRKGQGSRGKLSSSTTPAKTLSLSRTDAFVMVRNISTNDAPGLDYEFEGSLPTPAYGAGELVLVATPSSPSFQFFTPGVVASAASTGGDYAILALADSNVEQVPESRLLPWAARDVAVPASTVLEAAESIAQHVECFQLPDARQRHGRQAFGLYLGAERIVPGTMVRLNMHRHELEVQRARSLPDYIRLGYANRVVFLLVKGISVLEESPIYSLDGSLHELVDEDTTLSEGLVAIEAPSGYRFRRILDDGVLVSVAQSCVSGRYYPGIMDSGLLANESLRALTHIAQLEGLAHQDPQRAITAGERLNRSDCVRRVIDEVRRKSGISRDQNM